jgi:hypothetical protein
MSMHEREQVARDYKFSDLTLAHVNEFLASVPRDMLFVFRTANLVRGLNHSLGGSARQRFRIYLDAVARGYLHTHDHHPPSAAALVQRYSYVPFSDATIPLAKGSLLHSLEQYRDHAQDEEAAAVQAVDDSTLMLWKEWAAVNSIRLRFIALEFSAAIASILSTSQPYAAPALPPSVALSKKKGKRADPATAALETTTVLPFPSNR